jgi:hypothetical protein
MAARGYGFFALVLILNLTPSICQSHIFINKNARIFGEKHIFVGIPCNIKASCVLEIPDCNRQIDTTTAKNTKVARHAFQAMGQIYSRSCTADLIYFCTHKFVTEKKTLYTYKIVQCYNTNQRVESRCTQNCAVLRA